MHVCGCVQGRSHEHPRLHRVTNLRFHADDILAPATCPRRSRGFAVRLVVESLFVTRALSQGGASQKHLPRNRRQARCARESAPPAWGTSQWNSRIASVRTPVAEVCELVFAHARRRTSHPWQFAYICTCTVVSRGVLMSTHGFIGRQISDSMQITSRGQLHVPVEAAGSQ
jgi:hypothetical protein